MDEQPANQDPTGPEQAPESAETAETQAGPASSAPETPQEEPEQPPQAVVSAQPRNHKKIALILLGLIVLLAAAAALAYTQLKPASTKPTHTASAKTADPYLVSNDGYVCVSAAAKAIQCENVATGKLTKYVLPDSFGEVFRVNVSPDGQKLQLAAFDATNTVHDFVVDRNMKILKVLQVENNDEDGFSYAWTADSTKLIYDLRTTGSNNQFGPSALYEYDLAAGTTKQLTHVSESIDYPVLMKNGMIVARKDAKGVQHPVIVNPDTGQLSPVEDTAFLKGTGDYPNVNYNIGTDAFYVANSDDKLLRIGTLHGTAGTYSLVPVQTIHGKVFANLQLVTAKGTPVQFGKTIDDNSITKLFDGGTVSTTAVNMGASLSFTAAQLPFNNPAPTNKVVRSDYLLESKMPPAGLQKFLEAHVADGCKAGNYRQIFLLSFNADGTQAAVEEGSCGFDKEYESIYVYQDGTYKNVGSSQEGFDCTLRDKYDLSSSVLPACHKPGDEL